MDKLECKCGNVINTGADDRSNKGLIIKEPDEEEFFDIIYGNLGTLLEYKPDGVDRYDWIIENLGEDYPEDSSMYMVIRDYINEIVKMFFKRIYECKNCGALWLQEDKSSSRFKCYHPE